MLDMFAFAICRDNSMNLLWLFCLTGWHLHFHNVQHNKMTGEFKASCDDCGRSFLRLNNRNVAEWNQALDDRATNEGWFYC
jgi:hypothetical protein